MNASISLTAFDASDAEFVVSMAMDPHITAFIGDGKPWSEEYTRQRISSAMTTPEASWFIARLDDTRVGLFTAAQREDSTEIGYWIAPDFWGQGLAKKIIGLGMTALKAVGVTEFTARVMPENKASLKALFHHGFQLSGEQDQLLILRRVAREG